jgi:hypothetical protein
VNSTVQRNEQFFGAGQSVVSGQAPALSAALSSRRLGTTPVFLSLQGDAGRLLYEERRGNDTLDGGLGRVDVLPQVRAALLNAPFLSVTGQLAYRYTWYTESLDAGNQQVPLSLSRQYAQMGAEVIGPVFSRVFTPGNRLADRLKHVIEPAFSVQRTTSIDNQDRVALLGNSSDFVVGGATRVNYALTNRVLIRKQPPDDDPAATSAAPRELLSVTVQQSYYTDDRASQFDRAYASSFGGRRPSRLSPLQVALRARPAEVLSNTLRLEFDPQDSSLMSLSAGADVRSRPAEVNVAWSRRRLSATAFDNVLQGGSQLRFADGRVGGTFSYYWDITRRTLIQQRWIGFYNAQCCGIAFEYQAFAFANPNIPVASDRRFNMSFTLAGIGTFSNFFGAFGGGSRY